MPRAFLYRGITLLHLCDSGTIILGGISQQKHNDSISNLLLQILLKQLVRATQITSGSENLLNEQELSL